MVTQICRCCTLKDHARLIAIPLPKLEGTEMRMASGIATGSPAGRKKKKKKKITSF